MRISHNLPALNTLHRLNQNHRSTSNSLAKLSSGRRINKAADDAAGLAISEKMRSQIRGLNQAERNIQDGISLIQTAEGGLQEITDIIKRQRELIVRGLNDTLTDNDRQKIDQELRQLTEEINSISEKTQFNTIGLLSVDHVIFADRSSSNIDVSVSNPSPATSVQTIVEYKPKGTLPEERHLVRSTDTTDTNHSYSNTNSTASIVLPDGREGYNERNVDILTTTKTDTNVSVYETLTPTDDPEFEKTQIIYSVGRNDTIFGPKGFGNAYGSLLEYIEVNGNSRELIYTSRSNPGTVPAWDFMRFPNTDISITRYRTVTADNSMEITYVITNGDSSDANIKLQNMVNPPSNSTITDGGGNPIASGTQITTPPSTFHMTGTDANADIIFNDALGLPPTEISVDNPTSGQPRINFDWDLSVPQGGSITLGFHYGPFSLNVDVFERTRETVVTQQIETTVLTDITDIDYTTKTLDIQAGANEGEVISIPLFNVSSQKLGIADLGVSPPAIPEKALAQADGAIERILNYRGLYGAMQNRLEHTMNNVGNVALNMTAAESRIRDADMAKEMTSLTKTNLLTQSAQAMLAQANQHPQAVLQLLKS
ncbi:MULTISPECIES: flagellin [unclassified Paenibacillus]|uniref:flagellin N-terminal helical domain-containing protein n=1 Tax=unclassified Paenibacillus TaxID=185978 RepID=UPI000BA75086|nr:flagellin [Paenibacillus sp. 7541]PAK55083.1 flagellar protein [Paenibacillus sp. 7541]